MMPPILVADLFPEVTSRLVELLRSLSAGEWHLPTVSSRRTVKDIASHLLDGSLRRLSMQRDGYRPADGRSQPRQQLTDLQAWDRGGNRLVFAADFHGGVGLHIERIELADSSKQKQANDRFRASRNRRVAPRRRTCPCRYLGQTAAESPQSAGHQELAACNAVTGTLRIPEYSQHADALSFRVRLEHERGPAGQMPR
jgi:hypothetical protein